MTPANGVRLVLSCHAAASMFDSVKCWIGEEPLFVTEINSNALIYVPSGEFSDAIHRWLRGEFNADELFKAEFGSPTI